MNLLSEYQKQLIFDFVMGVADQKECSQAEELIFSNEKAAELHTQLRDAFYPLNIDYEGAEDCPDELYMSTLSRIRQASRAGEFKLEQLLAKEQAKNRFSEPISLWRGMGQRLAMAAVFIIVGVTGIMMYNLSTAYLRQRGWQTQCQMNLAQISNGVSNYASDHDGKLPSTAFAAGSPWWKIGYNGSENHSNTRQVWQLVKDGYVQPEAFICPASVDGEVVKLDKQKIRDLNDFPGRKYITYSVRIICDEDMKVSSFGRRVFISDMNPIFKNLPEDYTKELLVQLNRELIKANSPNHRCRGQNILYGDGSVEFVKVRHIGESQDDIFTLKDKNVYQGTEVPTCTSDAFLAP